MFDFMKLFTGSLCNHGAGTGGSTSTPSPSLKLRDLPRIFSSENVTVPPKKDAITTKLPKTTKQNMLLPLILNKYDYFETSLLLFSCQSKMPTTVHKD